MSNASIIELENIKKELLKEVEAIETTIGILKAKLPYESILVVVDDTVTPPVKTEYKVNNKPEKPKVPRVNKSTQTNTDIVLMAFQQEGRFIRKSDIIKAIDVFGLKDESIRFAVSYLRKTGTLVAVQATSNYSDTFWGLKEWIVDGKIKDQYLYDSSSIVGKKK